MSAFTIAISVQTPVRFLKVAAVVPLWEDAIVNGLAEDGSMPQIPLQVTGYWCPIIDLDTGIIEAWPQGTIASVHYEVGDDGRYTLLDLDHKEVLAIEGPVPRILSPGGNGDGKFIVMNIGSDGQIAEWHVDLQEFSERVPA